MATPKQIANGYGKDFPGLEVLFNIEPTSDQLEALSAPIPALGRYRKYVQFLNKVTSQRTVNLLRFYIISRYFLFLNQKLHRDSSLFTQIGIVAKLALIHKFGNFKINFLNNF